jgi:thiamine biosynthesis protein ThiS
VKIEVNGEAREVADGVTVEDLVRELGLRPEIVAVERNRELVTRTRRSVTRLEAGDRVEVVTLVGGG